MKKIAVIETGVPNHTPILVNWAKICNLKGWELTVYTTQDCYQLVESKLKKINSFKGVKFIEDLSLFNLKRYHSDLKKYDDVLIASLYGGYLKYFLLIFFCKNFSLTMHNVNKWFVPVRTGDRFLSEIKSYLSFFLRKLIIRNIKKIIVNSENQKKYLKEKYAYLNVHVIPFKMDFFPKNDCKVQTLANIVVVYPGIISFDRKRYDNFILISEKFPQIKFVLLGEMSNDSAGKYILAEIEKRQLKNVVYFRNYVSNDVFEYYMNEASVIFSDINIESNGETYGQSKDSGAPYLMAEYGLPFIVNSDFKNIPALDAATSYYHDQSSLIKIFECLIIDPTFLNGKISLNLRGRETISLKNVASEFKGFD
ncbi:glycosyltransferase [Shewanella sp. AS1]|uniref:glycosyltransferase n=1 Tax=Shewanella sp. AS1 TaxID=2907626 RepID=UPI001F24822A|nr:glycosyltransferase [Shewanella sp. AS1]MCE9680055.1 glycosyltransferase [Shewanella sp. AS1]